MKKFTMVWLFAALCMLAAVTSAGAEEAALVRVGVYELEGFHSFEADGSCVGYDVDYLNRIANVTGWDYEFVKADSWAQAMDMLRSGEIDLLSPSQMTTSRLEEFGFSVFPIGKVYAAILTLKDSPTIYEDFDAFEKMTFGIETGNTYTGIFEDYARSNCFTPNIVFFENHSELVKSLRSGKVDAIVANVMRAEPDMRLLGKAGTAQFYYMYRKDNEKLAAVLNEALDQIEIDEPNFQSELVSAYFPIYNEEPFSKSELEYVEGLPTIRVACTADARPYSFLDEKTGKLTGILVDYLTQTGAEVGLSYEFVPLSGTVEEDFLETNGIHLTIETGLSPIEKNRGEGVYSNNVLKTQQLIVCAPHVNFSLDGNLRIAWFGLNNIGSRLMKNSFPNFEWIACESAEKCFAAVKKGEADGCMVNQFAANWYLAMPRYEEFVMVSNSSIEQSVCLKSGVESDGLNPRDATFMRVINKSFKQISDIQEQQITIRYTTAMPYKLTVPETLYKYRYAELFFLMLSGMLVVSLVVYARNRDFKAQRDPMTGLYNRNSAKKMITRQLLSGQYSAGALLMLDLDHFKAVNDTLGHQAGDRLLMETADFLRKSCRSCDVVCRLGGDEFLIYLSCNDPNVFLENKLEQLRAGLEKTVTENGEAVSVSCSIGAALVPQDGKDMDELYLHADKALYCAKENGRNGYAFYSGQKQGENA